MQRLPTKYLCRYAKKNANNDMLKLDLHGLHALEAVHALEDHLSKMETMDKLMMGRACKGATTTRPRQNIFHVITETGTHSKGQASLPSAVRSFLIDKGYRFEEARPGVIDVRPKFRYKIQKTLDDKECSSSCEVQMFNNVKFIKIMTIDLVSEDTRCQSLNLAKFLRVLNHYI